MNPAGACAWTYRQRTGELLRGGAVLARGYSGHGLGRDEPTMQAVACVGPIPVGSWEVRGPPFYHPRCGPYCLRLVPLAGTDTHGREGFLVHGDSIRSPGTASEGCIILPRAAREAIWTSGVRELLVVAGEPVQVLA